MLKIMEYKIKKLSTNRIEINGIVYKRVNSDCSCIACYFYNGTCMIDSIIHCTEIKNGKTRYYHLIPNEL